MRRPVIGLDNFKSDPHSNQIIKLLKNHLKDIDGKTIGILGLAFKPDTEDIRDSRSVILVEDLLKKGAKVKAFDPKAMDHFKKLFPAVTYYKNAKDVLDSDAIIIATAWDEFKKLDYTGKIVLDGRRLLEVKRTAKTYEGVCW